MLSTPQERKIFSLPYANGDTVRVSSPDLPRSVYPYWIFRLSGALSKTEGCAGTLVDESPFTLIRGLRLYQDSELIKDIDLAHLRVLSHFIYRGIDTSFKNITLGTDAAETFNARVALDPVFAK